LGSYAVLGNHDHWTGDPAAIRAVIEDAGVELVTGRCADLTKRDASLSVCGTEVPWGEGVPAKGGSLPRVVLSHTPDNAYALADEGAFAVFAGHTHAGQIRLPFLARSSYRRITADASTRRTSSSGKRTSSFRRASARTSRHFACGVLPSSWWWIS
jgi:hypothetical protein